MIDEVVLDKVIAWLEENEDLVNSNDWSEIYGITNSYNYKSTETKNKTIYIHVKDKVGNISTQKVVITKIDATAPICNVSSTKTDFFNIFSYLLFLII